jgi:hypothetical protein
MGFSGEEDHDHETDAEAGEFAVQEVGQFALPQRHRSST